MNGSDITQDFIAFARTVASYVEILWLTDFLYEMNFHDGDFGDQQVVPGGIVR